MVERLVVDLSRLPGHLQQRLDLTGKREAAPVKRPVHRFDAPTVAHQPHLAGPPVPERESKHAPEALKAGDAPLEIGPQQHLRVAVVGAPACDAQRNQFPPDPGMIVDLAVEDELHPAVVRPHRLVRRGGKIDDRQPAVGQPDIAVS